MTALLKFLVNVASGVAWSVHVSGQIVAYVSLKCIRTTLFLLSRTMMLIFTTEGLLTVFLFLVIYKNSGADSASISASQIGQTGSDILPVVNTATNLIALTITPVFLAMISQTKKLILPRMVLHFILVTLSIIYGVMACVLSAMLILKLLHTWRGMS